MLKGIYFQASVVLYSRMGTVDFVSFLGTAGISRIALVLRRFFSATGDEQKLLSQARHTVFTVWGVRFGGLGLRGLGLGVYGLGV